MGKEDILECRLSDETTLTLFLDINATVAQAETALIHEAVASGHIFAQEIQFLSLHLFLRSPGKIFLSLIH